MVGLHHGENSDCIAVHMESQMQEEGHVLQRTLTLANYPSIAAVLSMSNLLGRHIMQYELHREEIKQSMRYEGNHSITDDCIDC